MVDYEQNGSCREGENSDMGRTVGIGIQSFEKVRDNGYFYIDKTDFIKEWWENGDDVTLITRPRRFGKTLAMDMLNQFFSVSCEGKGRLFEGLSIWKEERYRKLQGTYPVIFLSFAGVKEKDYPSAVKRICQLLTDLYHRNDFLLEGELLSEKEKAEYDNVSMDMPEVVASMAIHKMSEYLSRYYGKNVIILLDEYDTPLQEAYVGGYWDELVAFTRSLFNVTFKTNPYLERAVMTGITRVSKESVFSDLNNLEVITTTSEKYETAFGFTQQEVWDALNEYRLSEQKAAVRDWYDGFTFGKRRDIYNPWSILNYLDKRKLSTYWANTSSNRLIERLIRGGSGAVKMAMEDLLEGKTLLTEIEEQLVFDQLGQRESAIWSLFLASGYLKVKNYTFHMECGRETYELVLTNKEVRLMFERMIRGWFSEKDPAYNSFIRALLRDDKKEMNLYMNKVALATFSYFDTGKKVSEAAEPERFYHGFVLGLLVELQGRYHLTSNRESGYGRYDVMLEPLRDEDPAVILEFKVYDPAEERTLEDTAKAALAQIEKKKYGAVLEAKGIAPDRIRQYGFAFEGKKVLIV